MVEQLRASQCNFGAVPQRGVTSLNLAKLQPNPDFVSSSKTELWD
jgi:hypothetical protein